MWFYPFCFHFWSGQHKREVRVPSPFTTLAGKAHPMQTCSFQDTLSLQRTAPEQSSAPSEEDIDAFAEPSPWRWAPPGHAPRDPMGEVELQVSRCPKAAPLGTLGHGGMLRGSHSCVHLEGSGRGGVVTQQLDGSFSNSNSAETENVSIKRVLSWTPHRNHSRAFDVWDRLRNHTNCKPRKLLGDRGRPKPSRLLPPSPTSGCSAQCSKLCSKWTALNLFFFFFSFLKYFGGASTPTGLLSQQPSASHMGGPKRTLVQPYSLFPSHTGDSKHKLQHLTRRWSRLLDWETVKGPSEPFLSLLDPVRPVTPLGFFTLNSALVDGNQVVSSSCIQAQPQAADARSARWNLGMPLQSGSCIAGISPSNPCQGWSSAGGYKTSSLGTANAFSLKAASNNSFLTCAFQCPARHRKKETQISNLWISDIQYWTER